MAHLDVETLKSIAAEWLGVDLCPRLILAHDRTIRWTNARAREILAQVPTVLVAQERLSFRHAVDESRFGEFLEGNDEALRTTAIAFDGGASHVVFRARYIARYDNFCVEISLDHAGHSPKLANIAQVFGLTSSEAKTAVALFEGESVTGIASLHKVSVGTVRTHVRQIYAKLGTGNREQFFRRLQAFRIA